MIYVEDAAAATVAALEGGRPGEAYNVVDDEPVAWGEFFGALAKAFGTPPPREVPSWIFRFVPYAGAMIMGAHRLSNAKAKRELGWGPIAPTYREGIPRFVQALGERGAHYDTGFWGSFRLWPLQGALPLCLGRGLVPPAGDKSCTGARVRCRRDDDRCAPGARRRVGEGKSLARRNGR